MSVVKASEQSVGGVAGRRVEVATQNLRQVCKRRASLERGVQLMSALAAIIRRQFPGVLVPQIPASGWRQESKAGDEQGFARRQFKHGLHVLNRQTIRRLDQRPTSDDRAVQTANI